MSANRLISLVFVCIALTACGEGQPPRSVAEFMEDRLLLEAALVRCTANRAESRYEAECVNAREAVKLIEADEEKARRAEFEKLSERKREALRRTQQAASEARQRAAELEKLRREAEYQAQFGLPVPTSENGNDEAMAGNEPLAVIPEPVTGDTERIAPREVPMSQPSAATSSETPTSEPVPAQTPAAAEEEPVAADLGSIRDELRRRNESGDGEAP